MKKLLRNACLVVVFIAMFAPIVNGQIIYDLSDDWSYSSNPNGTWSYNEGTNPLTNTEYEWGGVTGETFWRPISGHNPPAMCKAVTTTNDNWQAGDVMIHSATPTAEWGLANVTWTASSDGTINIDGFAWDAGHSSDRDDLWRLSVNDTIYAQKSSIYGLNKIDAEALFGANLVTGMSLDEIEVVTGDVVKFELEALTTYGSFVGVDMQIDFTTIPEPATVSLLVFGGLALLRKRK